MKIFFTGIIFLFYPIYSGAGQPNKCPRSFGQDPQKQTKQLKLMVFPELEKKIDQHLQEYTDQNITDFLTAMKKHLKFLSETDSAKPLSLMLIRTSLELFDQSKPFPQSLEARENPPEASRKEMALFAEKITFDLNTKKNSNSPAESLTIPKEEWISFLETLKYNLLTYLDDNIQISEPAFKFLRDYVEGTENIIHNSKNKQLPWSLITHSPHTLSYIAQSTPDIMRDFIEEAVRSDMMNQHQIQSLKNSLKNSEVSLLYKTQDNPQSLEFHLFIRDMLQPPFTDRANLEFDIIATLVWIWVMLSVLFFM